MAKIVFEAGARVKFDVNLKETLDCVKTVVTGKI
jgi:hypothetical protein